MATKGMYKLDDGNCCPTNCFPARSLLRSRYEEGAGHWQVARRTAEKTKIELLFGTKAPQVRLRRPETASGAYRLLDNKTLDGAQLIKLHHVKSPSHLCSVDISNQNFVMAKEEDFEQFDCVAYINATENLLTLDAFRTFPGLRELELSLNGLRNLKVNAGDFPHLEVLDLSYNNLSPEDVRALGILSHLKALHLTANGLTSLPLDLAAPESESSPRFPALEVLLLDDNRLSHANVFVSLANLRSLKQLNLDRNGIREVPYLHHLDSGRFSIHPLSAKSGIREGLRSRKSAGKQIRQDKSPAGGGQPEYIVFQNSKDPDRTEVIFPSWSPDLPTQESSPSPQIASKASCASFIPEFTLPLPELRFLSLANNQIEHEEDLLAVALFPSLTELTFHGNPFTTSRSGDPPLLTSFLQNKLGIKMVRKKISKLEKPRIFIPNKPSRKVKAQLPKVQKRPQMLEDHLETTFWQLWTGADLDPNKRVSLDEPLPPIKRFSLPYKPEKPVLPLKEEEISAPSSLECCVCDASADQLSADQLEDVPEGQSSLADLVFGNVASTQPPVEQLPPEPPVVQLPPEPPVEQLPPEENLPEPSPLITAPSKGQDLPRRPQFISLSLPGQDHGAPVPPPNSPLSLQEQGLSEGPPAEPDQLRPFPPRSSLLPGRSRSEPLPPAHSPAGEQDLSGSPARSLSVGQGFPDASPPAGPPAVEGDHPEPIPPASSAPQGPDLPELVPATRLTSAGPPGILLPTTSPAEGQDQVEPTLPHSSASESLPGPAPPHLSGTLLPTTSSPEGQDQVEPSQDLTEPISPSMPRLEEPAPSEPVPPPGSPPAEQDHLEPAPLPSSPAQEQIPPEPVPPPGSPPGEQDLAQPSPPSAERNLSWTSQPTGSPPRGQDHLEPVPPATSPVQEPDRSGSEPQDGSEEEEFSESRPASLTSVECGLSGSSSRELYMLFAKVHSSTKPIFETYDSLSSEGEVFSGSGEFVEAEETESIFMTQVDEESGPLPKTERAASPRKMSGKGKRQAQPVPEKYKGYEELLGGDPGADFVDPVGIQHNVQALEKALRYPRVYRESKARLDSYQKPYVPAEKKALSVRPPPPEKTRLQKLEEILLKMRNPTNIIQMPLVCILRRKKDNWREYRQALAMLKEFRKEYKAAVASCNKQVESKAISKKGTSAEETSQNLMLEGLPEAELGGQSLEESSVPTEEKGLSPSNPKKAQFKPDC
ncbi:X-ray radiation resistance-associated protein 1 [Podarcis lilfordi]|uniref:X-ray radiation resistance-associated protein 1 n=1 Tax=Podarcis lilfordi TaxID=74358 RepID=A0AA35KA02_9SAUR|nr:X-ray radiation resistance-associated protein 1 [Podarcis lilfordi]